MAKASFQVDDEAQQLMSAHPEVNWSAVFRRAIREHVELLELAEQIREERAAAAFASDLKAGVGRRWRDAVEPSSASKDRARRQPRRRGDRAP